MASINVFHLNNGSVNCPKNRQRCYRADPERKAGELRGTASLTARRHNSKTNANVCLPSNGASDEMEDIKEDKWLPKTVCVSTIALGG